MSTQAASSQPEVLRHSELLSQLVLDRATMEEVGRIETLWMYIPAHRVLGFICKSGFLGRQKFAFNLSQLQAIGDKSILVEDAPQATDGEKVRQLESLINAEVWTDAGNKIGKITDYRFRLKDGDITDYLFTANGLSAITDGVYRLRPSQILSLGRRVVVATSTVERLELDRDGIKRKLGKVGELLREEYSQVAEEAKSLTQQARSVTQRAKDRVRDLAEQAIETSQTLAEQAKETSQRLAEQVKEQAEIIKEELAEDFATQAERDRARDFRDRDFEGASDSRRRDRSAPSPSVDDTDWLEEDWDIETPPTAAQPRPQRPTPAEPVATQRVPVPAAAPEEESDRAARSWRDLPSSDRVGTAASPEVMPDLPDSGPEGDWDIETPPVAPLPPHTVDTVATVTQDFSVELPDSILEDDFWDIETPPSTPTPLNLPVRSPSPVDDAPAESSEDFDDFDNLDDVDNLNDADNLDDVDNLDGVNNLDDKDKPEAAAETTAPEQPTAPPRPDVDEPWV